VTWNRRLRDRIIPLSGCIALIAAWALLPSHGAAIPPLGDVLERGRAMLVEGRLAADLGASLLRVALGGLAALGCTVLFCGLATSPGLRLFLLGPLELARPIPPIAWIPLMIVLFGVGEPSSVAIVTLAAFFPMALAVLLAFDEVDRDYVLAARTGGAGVPQLIRYVYAPAMAPTLIVGIRLGIGLGWFSVVAAEMVGTIGGLGYGIQVSALNLDMESFFVYLTLIGASGFLMNAALLATERAACPWKAGRSREQ
jgi:ABC-type nitrate/sulfonate/bicarbonate transport system permease component